jgi:hypothetical protein
MPTLQSYINSPEVKPIYRGRYSGNGYFVIWANQLLEELQERGFLSAQIRESGQKVENGIWITPPSDLILLEKIYNPEDENQGFRVDEVNGKFKMKDIDLDPSGAVFETAAFATNSTISSIDLNIISKAADVFKNYLLYISAGDLSGESAILSGNLISGLFTTRMNYLHNLVAAFDETKISGVELIPPQYYVVIKYHSLITSVSSLNDEMPIPDDIESRLVPTWLRWCCEREAMEISKESQYWEAQKNSILYSIQAKRSARVNPSRGRRLVGLERMGSLRKQHPPYSSCG